MSDKFPSYPTCLTEGCIVRRDHTDEHMDAMGDRFTDDWTIDSARHWWCKECRRFTEWEFRGPREREDERCTICRPSVETGALVSDSDTTAHIRTPIALDQLCPSGCGCKPGEADMRDCACDGPCVFNEAWR